MSCFSIFCKKRRATRQESSHRNEGKDLIHGAYITVYITCYTVFYLDMFLIVTFNPICVDLPGCTNIKRYTYNEIVRSTENFNPSNKIGQGGFGSVYKVIFITFNKDDSEIVINVDVFDIGQLNGVGTAQGWNNCCCQGPLVRVKARSKGVSERTHGNFRHFT